MNPTHLPLTPASLYWAYPWMLLLLLALPGLWWIWLSHKRRSAIRFSSLAALRSTAGAWRTRARLVLPGLRTAALGALIVAAARPQRADETSRTFAEGIAIQLVVDTSGSMRDTDLSPRGQDLNRLDVVKDVIRRFVEGDDNLPGRKNDLVGLIRFARYADSICPLTLDHNSLMEVLANVHLVTHKEEDGTAIGDGLALAVERMKDLTRLSGAGEQLKITSRVIILLTDGENNASAIEPERPNEFLRRAGEAAAAMGLKVYTILAGTGEAMGYMMPDGRMVVTARRPLDETPLRRIAEITGGKFYRARDAGALDQIYAEIDKLERTRTEERRYLRWGELAWPWLATAFLCVCAQMLLDSTLLRKIP